jgi:hypothetical protein
VTATTHTAEARSDFFIALAANAAAIFEAAAATKQ